MSGQSERDAAGGEDQMEDQEAFREDPRGKQQVSEQQPETQAEDDGGGDPPAEGEGRDEGPGEPDQAGRDDPGEATGNPPNAG